MTNPIDGAVEELRLELIHEDICPINYKPQKECDCTVKMNLNDIRVKLTLAFAAGKREQLEEVLKVIDEAENSLPKKIPMSRAVKARSDAGAGHVIGHNYLLEDCRKIFAVLKSKLTK